jgi:hypothetical protein
MSTKGSVSRYPRCKSPVPEKGRGRPAIWCTQTCRRAAYEERSAAGSGAVAVEVVDRIRVSEHDLSECVDGVTGSPLRVVEYSRRWLNWLVTAPSPAIRNWAQPWPRAAA